MTKIIFSIIIMLSSVVSTKTSDVKKHEKLLVSGLHKSIKNQNCPLAMFYFRRLKLYNHKFTSKSRNFIKKCTEKIFKIKIKPVLKSKFANFLPGIKYLKVIRHSKVAIEGGYIYIGWVPYLRDLGIRAYAESTKPNSYKYKTNQYFKLSKFVKLSSFMIDGTEISAKQYGKSSSNAPVTKISYKSALKWCRKHGGDLPTEDQWEFAARSSEYYRSYTWGELIPAPCQNKTSAQCSSSLELLDISPLGVRYMGTRVSEWVKPAASRPVKHGYAIIKGAAKGESYYWSLTPSRRAVPQNLKSSKIGFRCVYPATKH